MGVVRTFKATCAVVLSIMAGTTVAKAQTATIIALPAQSLLFAPVYIALERGIFKSRGLDPKLIYVTGPGVIPAVLGGSADFTFITGATHLSAAVRNQRLLAIANTQDRVTSDIVVRSDLAKKMDLPADADTHVRMRGLKGATIGVDAINGLPHTILKFLAIRAGLNPESDLTITPLQPQAMVSALKAGTIQGMIFSPPFTVLATKSGEGTVLLSGPSVREKEFESYPYNVVLARPDFCAKAAQTCRAFTGAIREAIELMQSDPDASLKALGPTFEKMDPDILRASFQNFAKYARRDLKLTSRMYENIVSFDRITGIIAADAKVPAESEIYSNEFIAD